MDETVPIVLEYSPMPVSCRLPLENQNRFVRQYSKLYLTHIINIKKNEVGLQIKKIIEQSGNSADWFIMLDNHRNVFMHNAAPYFTVDVSEGAGKYDLLIMKENIKCFDDHEKFIALSEIDSIVKGFSIAKPGLGSNLGHLFKTGQTR